MSDGERVSGEKDVRRWWREVRAFEGMRPFAWGTVGRNVVAGVTMAAMSVPQSLGYTRIAGTPVITGLYTLLLPLLGFAIFGSSRYLVVAADSATAAILAGGLASMGARRGVRTMWRWRAWWRC